jgi:hypothetical protein
VVYKIIRCWIVIVSAFCREKQYVELPDDYVDKQNWDMMNCQ